MASLPMQTRSNERGDVTMQVVLCDFCPPCTPDPATPAGADGGHYEELPVSVPPRVPQGLSRDDAPGLGPDQWEEGAYAEDVE
ncbi:hypothetical protein ZWY2020_033629 [Hordeum vulgare]|nr:hypothetical protein ZWY2020_033629 [Hordeum vulgare]